MTSIRTEVREVEKHLKQLDSTKEGQIKIASVTQGMAAEGKFTDNERTIKILAIVKNRIIHSA